MIRSCSTAVCRPYARSGAHYTGSPQPTPSPSHPHPVTQHLPTAVLTSRPALTVRTSCHRTAIAHRPVRHAPPTGLPDDTRHFRLDQLIRQWSHRAAQAAFAPRAPIKRSRPPPHHIPDGARDFPTRYRAASYTPAHRSPHGSQYLPARPSDQTVVPPGRAGSVRAPSTDQTLSATPRHHIPTTRKAFQRGIACPQSRPRTAFPMAPNTFRPGHPTRP